MQSEKVEKFKELVYTIYDIAEDMEWGDPFAPGRLREILLAEQLGHTVAKTLHGEDAIDESGALMEYKTVVNTLPLTGRYDVSWQKTWEDQKEYLKTDKIENNKYHYFASFTKNYKIESIYRLTGTKVFELLLPKFEAKFKSRENVGLKNKSLHSTLSAAEIVNNSDWEYHS